MRPRAHPSGPRSRACAHGSWRRAALGAGSIPGIYKGDGTRAKSRACLSRRPRSRAHTAAVQRCMDAGVASARGTPANRRTRSPGTAVNRHMLSLRINEPDLALARPFPEQGRPIPLQASSDSRRKGRGDDSLASKSSPNHRPPLPESRMTATPSHQDPRSGTCEGAALAPEVGRAGGRGAASAGRGQDFSESSSCPSAPGPWWSG